MASTDQRRGLSLPWIDGSGAITTGGTSQAVFSAAPRQYLLFQNISDTDMWINESVAAVADKPSVKVAAGASFEPRVPPSGAINVICSATGKKFVAKQAVY